MILNHPLLNLRDFRQLGPATPRSAAAVAAAAAAVPASPNSPRRSDTNVFSLLRGRMLSNGSLSSPRPEPPPFRPMDGLVPTALAAKDPEMAALLSKLEDRFPGLLADGAGGADNGNCQEIDEGEMTERLAHILGDKDEKDALMAVLRKRAGKRMGTTKRTPESPAVGGGESTSNANSAIDHDDGSEHSTRTHKKRSSVRRTEALNTLMENLSPHPVLRPTPQDQQKEQVYFLAWLSVYRYRRV